MVSFKCSLKASSYSNPYGIEFGLVLKHFYNLHSRSEVFQKSEHFETDNFCNFRIHWRLSTILKTSNKSVWSNVFWYVKVYIFQKFIQYTTDWVKTQILKELPIGQNKSYKKCPLFSFANSNSAQFYF